MASDKQGFPILTSEEAVESCKSMFGVAMSVDDILRPSYQQMRRLYVTVLASFGVPTEQFAQPQFKFMDSFEHPELHGDSAPLVILALAMQRFMFSCGMENFSIFDIVSPKPKKTLQCISAVVNFTKFKSSREYVYDSAMSEVDAAGQQREQLMVRNKELCRKIRELKVKREEEDQQVLMFENEIQGIQSDVSDLNKQQAAEMKSIQQLKTSNAELSSKKAEIKANLAGLKQDGEGLKSKIVQSPERFRGELNRLASALQSVREARGERSVRLQEICAQQESSLQINEDAQTALKMITATGNDMDKLREEITKLEDLQDKNLTQKEMLRDLTAKIEQLRRQLASKQEKLSRLMRQHDKKVAATHDASGQLQREQTLLEQKMSEKEEYLQKLTNQINSLSLTIQEEETRHEEEMDSLRSLYQQMLEQLESYHQGLNRGWSKVSTATSKRRKDDGKSDG